jgi:hypothetical protein
MQGGKENSYTLLGMQICPATVEIGMEVPQKLKVELPYDLAVPLLGIYLRESKAPCKRILTHPCLLQHYSQ